MLAAFLALCAIKAASASSSLPGGPHVSIHDDIWPLVDHGVEPQKYDRHPWATAERRLDTVSYGSSTSFSTIRLHLDTSLTVSDADDNWCTHAGDDYVYSSGSSRYRATCTKDDVATSAKTSYLRNTILPAAEAWFEQHLRVVPVSGSLKLNPFCPYTIGGVPCCETHAQCSYASPNECYEAAIPASYSSSGRSGADFVLFVTARPTQGSTLAWAATCRSDQYDRPIAGHANFGPNRISTDPASLQEQIAVAIHEISHALGFSSSKFSQFRDHATGERRAASSILTSYTQNGKTVQKLTTPALVQAVREQFGCPSADGAELEDHGGSGSAGSHLEKRIFANELMTATSSSDAVFSAISLSVFQDTGWYQVDFAGAQPLPFGKDQGCAFALGKCSSWPQSARDKGFYCTSSSTKKCYGSATKGYCNRVTYSSRPVTIAVRAIQRRRCPDSHCTSPHSLCPVCPRTTSI